MRSSTIVPGHLWTSCSPGLGQDRRHFVRRFDSQRGLLKRRVPTGQRRILRRMPRLQVYLPEDLYRAVKERRLPASELLQGAVRAELRRRELLAETERYLAELVDEVGEPSAAAVARAEALSKRVRGKSHSPKAS